MSLGQSCGDQPRNPAAGLSAVWGDGVGVVWEGWCGRGWCGRGWCGGGVGWCGRDIVGEVVWEGWMVWDG